MIDIRYWLLDAAVEHSVPLPTLASPNVAEILNRKPHGLPPDKIAEVLAQMCDAGVIVLGDDAAMLSDANAVRSTQILHLMSHPSRCSYQLTTRGGSEWEVWAKPQWSRFTTSCERGNLSGIGAATATFAEELLGLEACLNQQRVIIDRSIRRKTLRNWRATYWKTLPEGHLIAFRTRPLSRSEWSPMPHREWARSVDLRKFYLRPANCG